MKQYAASPIMNALIDQRSEYFNTKWVDDFYSNIFDDEHNNFA